MNIPNDKLMHFTGGAIIFILAALLLPQSIAALLVWAVAGGKELYDQAHPESHTFDGWDAYWTVAGGVLAAILQWLWFKSGFLLSL
ncbi:hypothetical protein [Iodobacter sp.]|uniref:hypothetical protein n=1 Tax=Iodobacter sp. TaxID=1915058 RepID=UPI0025FA6924|nr:hypothetical protein [Iodobacter sp.]